MRSQSLGSPKNSIGPKQYRSPPKISSYSDSLRYPNLRAIPKNTPLNPPDHKTIRKHPYNQILKRSPPATIVLSFSSIIYVSVYPPQMIPFSVQKKAKRMQPIIPQAPWTQKASRGSSIFILFIAKHAKQYVIEPINPITTAAHGSTEAHPAVMVTRPARIPFVKAQKSSLKFFLSPVIYFLKFNVNRPDEAGAKIVFIIAISASLLIPLTIPPDDPALKNNHPSHRIRVPSTAY